MRKLLTTAILLCATMHVSHAYYYITSHLQSDTIGPSSRSCSEVLIILYEHVDEPDGTSLDIIRGQAYVRLGDCFIRPDKSSNCPPVIIGDARYYADSKSPACTDVWLNYSGVGMMAAAALQRFLPQNRQALNAASTNTSDKVLIVPDPAYNTITVHARAKDLDGAELNIYDSAGRVMDGHRRFAGTMPAVSFTIGASEFPPGEYTASLTTKSGQTIVDRFIIL